MENHSKVGLNKNKKESLNEIKNHVDLLKKQQSNITTFKNPENATLTGGEVNKKNESSKHASIEEAYKTIFENSAVAIMLTDEHERIVSWNKYAENLLGMSKEELNLKPVRSLYPAEEWAKIRAENIRQKGMQHHLETKMIKKKINNLLMLTCL